MCQYRMIIPQNGPVGNPPPAEHDLICPACYGLMSFSSVQRACTCGRCGLVVRLTAETTAELTAALLGLDPDLPVPQILLLAAHADPAAAGHLAPAA